MSEAMCTKCGLPKGQCTCVKPDQTIVVRHEGLPEKLGSPSDELAKTREKLEQRESELAVMALKKLEKEATEWASVIPDEGKRNAVIKSIMDSEDPLADFQRKKEMLGLFRVALGIGNIEVKSEDDDGTEPVPPSGSARGVPLESRLLGSGIEQINKIYSTLEDKDASEQDKAKARRKADEMIQQFIAGRKQAILEDPRHTYYVGYSMCPQCLEPIFLRKGEKSAKKCNKCGAVLTKRVG